MRLYGGKYLRNQFNREIMRTIETRDAIVWEVNSTGRYARVKVQGSDQLIVARYPLSWQQTPEYMKVGLPVKIMHTSGNQGRIEIVGHGALLPTPTTDSTGSLTTSDPGNASTGLGLTQVPYDAMMIVYVSAGEYRIAGSTYSLDPIRMESTLFKMGMGGKMGDISTVVAIAPASTSLFRIDRIQVGADGVVDYTQGTPFASSAYDSSSTSIVPPTSAQHISVGTVLVYPNMSCVLQTDIDAVFSDPIPIEIVVTSSVSTLASDDTSISMQVYIRDQYGNMVTRGGLWNFPFTANVFYGNGDVGQYSTARSTAITFSVNNYVWINYYRSTVITDLETVLIQFTAQADSILYGWKQFYLSNTTST